MPRRSGRPSGAFPRRRIRQVRTRSVIGVLTEGEVTEPDYLRAVSGDNRAIRIRFIARGMRPAQLVERARDALRANSRERRTSGSPEYDEIWCVMDTDDHPGLDAALREAEAAGIRLAVSNPCFELWLLLHFDRQSAEIDRHSAQAEANRLGILDGKQLSSLARRELAARYPDAKSRALELDAMHVRNGKSEGSNPSSRVWALTDRVAEHHDQGS